MLASGKLKKLIYNMGISYTNSFLGFVTFLLLARLLGAVDYSMVAIGIAVGGFVMPLLDLGSAKTFVRDAISLKETVDIGELAQLNFNIRLTVALIVFFFLLLFSSFYMDGIAKIVSVVFLSLWVGMLGLYPTSWFDYFHKTFHQNLYVMMERFLVVLMIGVLMLLKVENLLIILVSLLLLGSRFFSIAYQVKLWCKEFSNNRFIFKFSLPKRDSPGINAHFTISLLANALLVYGNQLILASTGDTVGLSAYSFAFQLISLIFLFQSQAIRVLNRGISEVCLSGIASNLIRYLIYHVGFLVAVSAVMALLVFVVSKYIPVILDDIRFARVTEFMPLLCVWVVIAGAGQVITQYLLEHKQEKFHLNVSVLGGFFAFLLGLIFVPDYGAISVVAVLLTVHSMTISAYAMRLLYIIKLNVRDAM